MAVNKVSSLKLKRSVGSTIIRTHTHTIKTCSKDTSNVYSFQTSTNMQFAILSELMENMCKTVMSNGLQYIPEDVCLQLDHSVHAYIPGEH